MPLVLVCLLAASAWRFLAGSDTRRITLGPYTALGKIAADETSTLLGGEGQIVVIIPDPGPDRDPVMDAQLGAFKDALKARGGIAIKAVETVKMDPFMSMRTGGAMPDSQFLAMRQKHAGVAAFILFIGFPALSGPEQAELRQAAAKVVVVSAALPEYPRLLRDKVIRLAIVPRSEPVSPAPGAPKTLQEWFDQEYVVMRGSEGSKQAE